MKDLLKSCLEENFESVLRQLRYVSGMSRSGYRELEKVVDAYSRASLVAVGQSALSTWQELTSKSRVMVKLVYNGGGRQGKDLSSVAPRGRGPWCGSAEMYLYIYC